MVATLVGGAVPDGEDYIIRLIQDLQRKVAELESARTLDRATITALAGLGIRTGDFDGTDFANPGTQGNYFGGDGAVLNDLYLRPGSVGNDALTNPLRVDCLYSADHGFALTTAGTTPLSSQTWQVPDGYTTCVVHITSRVFAYNPTVGLDYLTARSRVRRPSTGYTFYGAGLPIAVSDSGGSGTSSSPLAVRLEDLDPGEDIVIEVQGWTAFAGWAADPGNTADIAGILLWTR